MAPDNPDAADAGDGRAPSDSGLHGLARSFLSGLGSEQKAQELDDQVDQLAPEGVTSSDMDALISASLAVGAARSDIRQQMRDRAEAREQAVDADGDADAPAVDGPLVQGREIEAPDGSVAGVRVFVDDRPDRVDVYRGERSLLVRTPDGEHEEPLGFDPARIERDDDGEVAEFVVRPPVGVEDGDAGDTDTTASVEDAPADDGDAPDDGGE
jgi:hypothetical protein